MQNDVDVAANMDELCHVPADQPEWPYLREVADIRGCASAEVIEGEHLVAVKQKSFAQVTAEEASSPRNDGTRSPHVIPLADLGDCLRHQTSHSTLTGAPPWRHGRNNDIAYVG